MISEKLAARINHLTYELYRLHGFTNSKVIIAYEDALKMSPDTADKMILDLEKEVKSLSMKAMMVPKSTNARFVGEVSIIRYVNNFHKIKAIKIIKDENEHKKAELITIVDKKIILKQENFLRKENFKINFNGLGELIKKSIDYDMEVNIYKAGAFDIIYLKNEDRENLYGELSEVFNSILKFNRRNLISSSLEINLKSLHYILAEVKGADTELYDKLNDILLDNYKLKEFLNIYKYARHFSYGLMPAYEEILYY